MRLSQYVLTLVLTVLLPGTLLLSQSNGVGVCPPSGGTAGVFRGAGTALGQSEAMSGCLFVSPYAIINPNHSRFL